MLHFITSILGIIITILFVIGTHEFAHFYLARLLSVKVLRFSIGFGKVLYRWQDKTGTEYVLSLIPLGGYVQMLDENQSEVAIQDKPFAFNNQPYYKKFLIVIAGPLTNIFCALILYWLIFLIGFNTVKPIIAQIQPQSIAAAAGLKPNQEIIKVDGNTILDWSDFVLRLMTHAGNKDQLLIETKNSNQGIEKYNLNLTTWNLNGLTPNPLASLGIIPFIPNPPLILGEIAKDSPAWAAGLQFKDKIIAVNHNSIKNWETLITLIAANPDKKIIFTLERNQKKLDIPVLIGSQKNILFQKTGYLGIRPPLSELKKDLHEIKFSPSQALAQSGLKIYHFTYFNFILIGKLITGKLSLQSLGGPITIFDTAGDALNFGLISFLGFLAFLSISIGVINFLPIPGLDGGHLFLQTIEFIIQKPIPEKILDILYRLGFMLLFFVLFVSLANDLLRL